MPSSPQPQLLRSCQLLTNPCHRSLLLRSRLHRSSSSSVLKPGFIQRTEDLPFQEPECQIQHAKGESWIEPQSLRTTLDKHREANRAGQAIDGYLSKVEGGIKRKNKKSASSSRPEGPVLLHPQVRRLVLHDKKETQTSTEYGGEVPALISSWQPTGRLPQQLQIPWVYELDRMSGIQYNVPALRRLSDEATAYGRYTSAKPAEDAAARKVYDEVVGLISAYMSEQAVRVELIGSRATGLHSPISDLDLNLSSVKRVSSEPTLALLAVIGQQLRQPETRNSNILHMNYFLRKAKVPLIDCVHVPSTLNVQLQATESSIESLELTKAFIAEYPTLPKLFRVLKQVLTMRGLTTGSTKGLTSYPLLIMIVTSLKLGKSSTCDSDNVGAQLLEFLDLFSTIDFSSVAIHYYPSDKGSEHQLESDLSNGSDLAYDPVTAQPILQSIDRKVKQRDYQMFLQDPADPSNDLGKSAGLMRHVQATFLEARTQIGRAMASWDQKQNHGLDMGKHGQPLLGWCLEGDYSTFEEARQKLRNYSQDLPASL